MPRLDTDVAAALRVARDAPAELTDEPALALIMAGGGLGGCLRAIR